MVQRILEQLPALSNVLSPDRKVRHLILTWQDIEVLEAINNTLTPLADCRDALSGEQYVSISSVKPVLHLFETSVLVVQEYDTDFTRSVKSNIFEIPAGEVQRSKNSTTRSTRYSHITGSKIQNELHRRGEIT